MSDEGLPLERGRVEREPGQADETQAQANRKMGEVRSRRQLQMNGRVSDHARRALPNFAQLFPPTTTPHLPAPPQLRRATGAAGATYCVEGQLVCLLYRCGSRTSG